MNRAAPTDPEPAPSDRAAVRLTREAIVAQAMLLVRAERLGAVSMRRIADELGTGPMSLLPRTVSGARGLAW